jgi:hypothetical protein
MHFTRSLLLGLAAFLLLLQGAQAQGLPPAVEADRLLQLAAAEMEKGAQADWPRVASALQGAEATGVRMPPNFDYHFGRALHGAGRHEDSVKRLERYLQVHGTKARYYAEATQQYTSVLAALAEVRARAAAQAEVDKAWVRYHSRWSADGDYDCTLARQRLDTLAYKARDVQCECRTREGGGIAQTRCDLRYLGNRLLDTDLPASRLEHKYPVRPRRRDFDERMVTSVE